MHRSIHAYAHKFCMHAYTYIMHILHICRHFYANTHICTIVTCMLVRSLALI